MRRLGRGNTLVLLASALLLLEPSVCDACKPSGFCSTSDFGCGFDAITSFCDSREFEIEARPGLVNPFDVVGNYFD